MNTTDLILAQLARMADDARLIALVWHLVASVAVASLVAGFRPSMQTVGLALTAPLVSVSAVAVAYGNPFNGLVFAGLAVGLSMVAARMSARPADLGPAWARGAGAAMIAFGWFYPHFLSDGTALTYATEAPLGVLPCPTLGLLIGVTLLAGGLRSRPWSLVLAAAGLFYGLFGAVKLGVGLDVALVAGASALAGSALVRPRSSFGATKPATP